MAAGTAGTVAVDQSSAERPKTAAWVWEVMVVVGDSKVGLAVAEAA